MNDDQLRQAYASWLAGRVSAGRENCVSPEELLALVEQRGSETERLATLDHAMSCAACRQDLETLRAVAAAGATEGVALGARPSWWSSPGFRIAAGLVLVASAGVGLLLFRPGASDVLRGGGEVVTVSPSGDVTADQARLLIWRRVAAAERYHVELLTVTGDSFYTTETVDTSATLPDTVLTGGARDFLWTVRALRGDGTQLTSLPRRFHLAR